MSNALFNDRRANGLLNRVREDVSHLRDDIGSLLSHTTKKTLPNGARELADHARHNAREFADHAKHQLAAGGAYAASRLRDFRGAPPRQSASWVGGAVVVGLLAYGAYALYKGAQERQARAEYEPEDEVTG